MNDTFNELSHHDINYTTAMINPEQVNLTSLNSSNDHVDLLNYLAKKYSSQETKSDDNLTIIIIYSLIAIISLFGNILVCFVLLKNKNMRTKTNILMANITVSGLMITIFNIPFNIARLLLNNWPFGQILCKLLPAIQVTSVYVMTLTMTIIAIDRYQAINSRFYRRISNVLPINITIKLIWIVATIFASPELIFNSLVEHKLIEMTRCQTVYPEPKQAYRRAIVLITFSTQYLIPLMSTTVAYIRIINKICRKYRLRDNDIQKRIKTTDRKIIKMLAIVVIVFAICWLPLNSFHIYAEFSPNLVKYNSLLFYFCHMLAMSSIIYNPFIYFGLNKHFRREIKVLFPCLPYKRRADGQHTNQWSSLNGSAYRSRTLENNNNYHNINLVFNHIHQNHNNRRNSSIDSSLGDDIVNRNLMDNNVF